MEHNEIDRIILERLTERSSSIREQWANPQGTCTRSFVVDDLLPEDIANSIYNAFPRNAEGFFERASFRERKKTLTDLSNQSPILSAVTYAMQAAPVLSKIAELVDFQHIVPDPTLYAAGLSMMFKGDFLNPHLDNSHGADRNLYRRLNLLYYVSPGWSLENGGNLELWDEGVKAQQTITAQFNRLVVMETNKHSWHSVSPVTSEAVRCCVSTYYFSPESPDQTAYFHVTSFSGRPEEPGRRILGFFDNRLRNAVSKTLRAGRGTDLINKRQD
jgi:Rps23 Pro-64 3,4-dihydroxylase Tpa1-like proline 4-hydroxylase